MNRIVLGAVAALLLASAGMFWWQGHAQTERTAPPLPPTEASTAGSLDDDIPTEDGEGLRGADLPTSYPVTREQKRFDRLDRNRDGLISRNEMLSARAAAFRKLDTDHNNLLSFEEWAVATSNRFKGADANGDGELTRAEFATSRPKDPVRPRCKC